MLRTIRALRAASVLGLNERNAEFIMRLNPRRFYPRVDDKVLTKQLAIEAGMAVPDLYGVIENQADIEENPHDALTPTISALINNPGQYPGRIDFRVHLTSDGWKVYDIVAGGQSAIAYYRGYFRQAMRNNRQR